MKSGFNWENNDAISRGSVLDNLIIINLLADDFQAVRLFAFFIKNFNLIWG